jgi:hypothetical protein
MVVLFVNSHFLSAPQYFLFSQFAKHDLLQTNGLERILKIKKLENANFFITLSSFPVKDPSGKHLTPTFLKSLFKN